MVFTIWWVTRWRGALFPVEAGTGADIRLASSCHWREGEREFPKRSQVNREFLTNSQQSIVQFNTPFDRVLPTIGDVVDVDVLTCVGVEPASDITQRAGNKTGRKLRPVI